MRYINNVRPNVIRGGQAIPIGNNMFYMKGRKHSQGGIDVGKDLEVEGGEIMQITPTEYKVFSAKKFLGGYSPAEKVLTGANPNRVFNEQENYKNRNHLRDDGTKKAEDGKKVSIEFPTAEKQVANSDFARMKREQKEKEDNQRIKNETIGLVKTIAENTPIIGDIMTGKEIYEDIKNDNKLDAAVGLTSLILPFGIGKAVKKFRAIKNASKINTKAIENATHITTDNNKKYYINSINNYRFDNKIVDKNINTPLIKEALQRESNIPLLDAFGNKLDLNNLNPETRVVYKGKSFYEKGKHRVNIDIKDIDAKSITHHEDNHYKRNIISNYIDDMLYENRVNNYKKLKQTTFNIDRLRGDAGAFTPEEQNILDDAYSFTDDFIKNKKGDISVLQEKASSNIELRDKIINYLKLPINVDRTTLNKKINNLSNSEIMYLLANTNGYTQNFYNKIEKQLIDSGVDMDAPFYILEDNGVFNNPIIDKQINDIKKALTTVGISSGVIATTVNNETKDKKAMGGIKRLHPFTGGRKRADLGTFGTRKVYHRLPDGRLIQTNGVRDGIEPITTEGLQQLSENTFAEPVEIVNNIAPGQFEIGKVGKQYNVRNLSSIPVNSTQTTRRIKPNNQQLYFAAPNELPQVNGPEIVFTVTKPNNTVAIASTPSPVKGTSTNPVSSRATRHIKSKVITPFTDPTNYVIDTDYDKSPISRNTKDIISDIEVPNVSIKTTKPNIRHKGRVTVTTNDDGTTTYTDSSTGKVLDEPKYNFPGPTFKQRIGNFIKDNGEDIISNVSNIAGSLISHGINRRAINKMKVPFTPIPKMATKMKTTFNANPQLTEVNNSYNASARNAINETTSSAVSQNKINRLNNWRTSVRNQIYGNKENIETQLINQDKLNQQQIAHANVDSYNQYLDRLTEFNNRKIDLASENDQALISGINSTIQNTLTNSKKFRQDLLNSLLLYGAHPNSQKYIENYAPTIKRMIEKALR